MDFVVVVAGVVAGLINVHVAVVSEAVSVLEVVTAVAADVVGGNVAATVIVVADVVVGSVAATVVDGAGVRRRLHEVALIRQPVPRQLRAREPNTLPDHVASKLV